jgi:hypothetical protein
VTGAILYQNRVTFLTDTTFDLLWNMGSCPHRDFPHELNVSSGKFRISFMSFSSEIIEDTDSFTCNGPLICAHERCLLWFGAEYGL